MSTLRINVRPHALPNYGPWTSLSKRYKPYELNERNERASLCRTMNHGLRTSSFRTLQTQ